jgi:hypothetical protein
MGFSYGQPDTVNPGRFRRQKERVTKGLVTRKKQREEQAKIDAQVKDRFYHTYAERVRLIRQIKTVLGLEKYPLLKFEDWEYESQYYTSKKIDDEVVKSALRYWDAAIPVEKLDGLMAEFDAFYMIESWLLQRNTLVGYLEWGGEWFKRPIDAYDRIPQFENPYWLCPNQIDTSNSNWREWKVRKPVETRDECSNPAPAGSWTEDMSCGTSVAQPAKKVGWCKQLYLKVHEALTGE